jgi:hypothetical protein
VHRSTSFVRRACAVGTATALIGLTTGLGVMTATTAYAAETPTTGTSATAPVAPGADTTAPGTAATAPAGDTTTPAEPGLPTDGATAPAGTDATSGDTTGGGDAAGTGATAPAAGTPTTPSKPSATSPAEPAPAAAATASVSISGKPQVGETLRAKPKGFTDPAALAYQWSVGGVVTGDQGSTYDVVAADAGKVVSVVVRNTSPGNTDETATATTADVTQTPVFVDENGTPIEGGTVADEDSLPLEATAGEAFSYTFRAQGSPAPKLALSWYYDGEETDPDYPEDTPEGQLPDGITFDAATGVLSGTTEETSLSDFAVTATSGTASVTQYVELSVDAAAPVGVQVFAADRAEFADFMEAAGGSSDEGEHSGDIRSWVIDERGAITTVDISYRSDDEGGDVFETDRPGGRPTIGQGGTLLTSGNLVDRFGNIVFDDDGPAAMTVTSDVASDVIAPDEDFGFFDSIIDVTFPHASTHTLTVSADDFTTSFPVEVVPTAAAPVATPPASAPPVVTPPSAAAPIGAVPVRTASHGRLAYTGTDSTDALPWALAMLAAGAALVGLRTVRRRAQR